MRRAGLILTILIAAFSLNAMATETKPDNGKNWYVGLAPVMSSSASNAVGGTANFGTTFALTGGYISPYSERIDLRIFYTIIMNTAQLNRDQFSSLSLGAHLYSRDRGATTTPYALVDLGYGYGNRFADAAPVLGLGFGMSLFRTNTAAFKVGFRNSTYLGSPGSPNYLNSNGTAVAQPLVSYFSLQQLSFEIEFQ